MRNKTACLILLLLALLLSCIYCAGAETSYEHVKIRRHKSPQDRVLVDKVGTLTFDDDAHAIRFASGAGDQLAIAYDNVTKVVFEVTSHMRGGALSEVVSFAGSPGAIASIGIAGRGVHDYWLCLEHKEGADTSSVLLEVPKNASEQVIQKAKEVFGDRVEMAEFQEKGEEIKKADLTDLQSKHTLKVNRQNHPLPETKPDKATIVVVCPPLAARYSGHGNQFKLHANDRVVVVNKSGTYSFAYVDPGKYRLVSQSENANGFEMELEAGKEYYFLQNTFQGALKRRTVLTRNSRELVMYELSGAHFSDWARKAGN